LHLIDIFESAPLRGVHQQIKLTLSRPLTIRRSKLKPFIKLNP
jgi:hypothetical protein